ncbi:uncharacterized protein BKCO1_10000121 [Diplodia corticola]|uniref:Uncharacterized protein n=1 Tax=Diplodia corticola TaxID=236234 RepID=A0A1J9SAL7_9PEZI|nr:uncharacterized protein BKCO1_10000121 [Diplodia corticola]OJD36621.1 hypothetical protein BKCO1_10000121 [Diplodia corticola]
MSYGDNSPSSKPMTRTYSKPLTPATQSSNTSNGKLKGHRLFLSSGSSSSSGGGGGGGHHRPPNPSVSAKRTRFCARVIPISSNYPKIFCTKGQPWLEVTSRTPQAREILPDTNTQLSANFATRPRTRRRTFLSHTYVQQEQQRAIRRLAARVEFANVTGRSKTAKPSLSANAKTSIWLWTSFVVPSGLSSARKTN